jgi:hypothetical protein
VTDDRDVNDDVDVVAVGVVDVDVIAGAILL